MTDDELQATKNGGTTTTAYRWKYLSSVLTLLVTGAYITLLLGAAFGHAESVDGGTWATFSLAFLAVIAYAVGVDTLKGVKEAQK